MSLKLRATIASKFGKDAVVLKIRKFLKQAFKKYLLVTNVTISSFSAVTGDCIQQNYQIYKHPGEAYDVKRAGIMGACGISAGFITHHWYILLEKFMPGKSCKLAFKKMLLDQCFNSPASIAAVLTTNAVLEGKSWSEIVRVFKCKFWILYVADWMVWPPAQVVNYYFLPLRYRVLYDNSISLCYDVYTSYVTNDDSIKCD